MPIVVAVLAALGVGAEASAVIGTIAGVIIWIMRIHTIIALIGAAFWFLVVYFSHEVFLWVIDIMFSLTATALSAFGIQDPTDRMLSLVSSIPPGVMRLFKRLHLFSHVNDIFKAYAVNFALTSIPLVGRIFKG